MLWTLFEGVVTMTARTSRSGAWRMRLLAAGILVLTACAPAAPSQPTGGAPTAKPAQPGASQPTQPAAPAQKPAAKKTLTVAYTTDLEGFNPFSHSTSTVYARWMHVSDPLVYYDEDKGAWVPHLAESWSNPDPTTWEFKLRKGVKFHDGSELIADDVIYTYERMKNDPESKQISPVSGITTMEAPDKYTVRIHTKTPDAAFPSRLDNRIMLSKAYNEKLGQKEADKHQIGTGLYQFKEWLPGQRLVLTKNPNYWGPFKSDWDDVIFRPIPEPEARITALLNGEVDVIANVPPQYVERLNSSGNAQAVDTRGDRLLFVGVNPITEPLKKKEVRQAISYAIDRDAIVKGVLQGRAYALDTPIGPDMYSYDANLQPKYTYNVQKAKELMAQAGYPDGFQVDFFTPVDRYTKDKDISTAIVSMLSQIGIKANLQTPEWSTFSDTYQKGTYPMYLIGRGDVKDPSEYLQQYFRTGVTKRLLFSDSAVDKALVDQAAEFDPAKRVELLRKAQSIIMEQSPAAFLLQYQDTYGISKKVSFKPRGNEYILAWEVKAK